mmetsp:Transcript_38827/g.116744  ORF Transcript_38827/g.116744 Transcript_38827/m.116744 type:complete len:477 (-) Transcript_38827:188-1618(-)
MDCFSSRITSFLVVVSTAFDMSYGATPSILDLSIDLEPTPHFADNPGADALRYAAKDDNLIRTVMVLENGKIAASYARDGISVDDIYAQWSVTKSWTSLIIGMMVDDGLIALNETLNDILVDPDDSIWPNVENTTFVQAVTIESLLTMTSGLIDPAEAWTDYANLSNLGGADLVDSLSFPDIGAKGEFSYLAASNIMSYVIQKRSGLTPQEFAEQHIFPALGINNEDIKWDSNDDGMVHSFSGLNLSTMHMAKFGQLFLQGGLSGPGVDIKGRVRIVSEEWVEKATSAMVMQTDLFGMGYGYLFWNLSGLGLGSIYCAIGLGGQTICVHKELNRVFIQQKDLILLSAGDDHLDLAAIALSADVSFEKQPEGNTSGIIEIPANVSSPNESIDGNNSVTKDDPSNSSSVKNEIPANVSSPNESIDGNNSVTKDDPSNSSSVKNETTNSASSAMRFTSGALSRIALASVMTICGVFVTS